MIIYPSGKDRNVSVNIHNRSDDSVGFEKSPYGFSVDGNTFGSSCPADNKTDIVDSIVSYIKSEEKYYNCKIKIMHFENETDLDITIADVGGVDNKLSKWV